jgi:phage terminase small subunit
LARKKRIGLTDQHMKVIDNFFANGFMQKPAARDAGFTGPGYASLLFKRDDFKKEVDRRLKAREKRYGITKDKVLDEYAKIAFTRFDDYYTIDPVTGDAMVDLSRVTPETLSAIGEYSVDTYMEGRGDEAREVKRVRIKLADKQRALDAISRIMGYNDDSVTIKGGLTIVERLQEGRNRVRDITPQPKVLEHDE